MSNLPLIYEMLLIVAIVGLIAWFMGRTFCKSNEYQARASSKSLSIEKQNLEGRLAEKAFEQESLVNDFSQAQQHISELSHQHDMQTTTMAALKQEQAASLKSLQGLKPYRIQYEELSEQHNEQLKQLMALKKTLEQEQQALQQHKTLLDKQNGEIASINEKKQQDHQEKQHLHDTINTHIEQIQTMQNEHLQAQYQLQLELQQQQQTISGLENESVALKQSDHDQRKENEKLQKMRDNLQKNRDFLTLDVQQKESDIKHFKQENNHLQQRYQQQVDNNKQLQQTQQQDKAILEQRHNETAQQIKHLQVIESEKYALDKTTDDQQQLIKQLQQDNKKLRLTTQQQRDKIDVLTNKVNSYLHTTNANNVKISSMLKALPPQG